MKSFSKPNKLLVAVRRLSWSCAQCDTVLVFRWACTDADILSEYDGNMNQLNKPDREKHILVFCVWAQSLWKVHLHFLCCIHGHGKNSSHQHPSGHLNGNLVFLWQLWNIQLKYNKQSCDNWPSQSVCGHFTSSFCRKLHNLHKLLQITQEEASHLS